ncbi:MAG TPA: DUF1707 domain-containing protein [Solirubrobacteraceae bacterium]
MNWPASTTSPATIRAGDDDRERTLDLLREHWLAGRLTLAEYEDRCDEVAQARFIGELEVAARELPPPPPPGGLAVKPTNAPVSCALGITSLVALPFSLGLMALLTLPMSITAWTMGHRARGRGTPANRSLARAGEVTGIIGAVLSVLALTAWALIAAAVF